MLYVGKRVTFILFLLLITSVNAHTASAETVTGKKVSKIVAAEGVAAAKNFLETEIQNGDIDAIHLYIKLLVSNRTIKKNIGYAIRALQKGVSLNDGKSAYFLGNIFSDGNFVTPDFNVARGYYEMAVTAGYSKAETKLASLPSMPKNPNDISSNDSNIDDKNKTSPVRPKDNTPQNDNGVNEQKSPDKNATKEPKNGLPPAGYSKAILNWESDYIDRDRISSFGSGFAITSDGVILTNEHVVDGCKRIFVVYQGRIKEARLLHVNAEHDFAAIKIPVDTPSFFYLKTSSALLGEEMMSGGFPAPDALNYNIKITTGIVSSEAEELGWLFQHTTPTQKGNSGGPLINKSGQIVGISTAVWGEQIGGLDPQNINFAVSLDTMKFNLKKWRLRFKRYSSNVKYDTTVLADMLKRSATQIICY